MFALASFFRSHLISTAQSVFTVVALAQTAYPLPARTPDAAPAQSAKASSPADVLVVRTTSGIMRGVARSNGGAQFLGIPYAEPPVGPLRWRAPVPHKRWPGVRNANSFGPACLQPVLGGAWNLYEADHSSEDCLYLNVTTPVWPASGPLPVMFWLHGGANIGGSGSGSLYNDGTIPNHGVILVTINYRLGILGYLAHPKLASESPGHASGNYGLMDQILALHWVHDNIARFGGDPNNVTVFGQSDGAKDAGILMTSPLARGLFQKAIAESGSPFYPSLTSLDQAEQAGQQFAASFPVLDGQNPIDFLRGVPGRDVVAKAANLQWGQAPVSPIVDGWVVPRPPEEVFKAGKEASIPLLLGITTREFGSDEPADNLRAAIENYAGGFAPRALELYGLANGGRGVSDPLYGPAGVQWNADIEFHCPVSTEALWQIAAHEPVYEYEFERAIPGKEAQGAMHSGELDYVFGYFPATGNIGGVFGPVDRQLADLMETYFTNFAKSGDPNGKKDNQNSADLPHWPLLGRSQHYLAFTEDGRAVASTAPLRGPQCDLYRETLAEKMKHPFASSTVQNPLHRRYRDGEILAYNMTGLNESWHYSIQADGMVRKDASGAYFEDYRWANLVSDGQPTALTPGSDSFRERLSLDPDQIITPPDLSNADPKLVGPALDFMTFYADLWLASKTGQLTHAGDHFYVKNGAPSSWANGSQVILGQSAVDFDFTLKSVDPGTGTAVLVARHVPPHKSQLNLPAAWMQTRVADTPNNWVQVIKLPGKFFASVGQETFTDELTVSLVDGKILSATMENPVNTIARMCSDEALTQCDPPQPHEIVRKIQIALAQ